MQQVLISGAGIAGTTLAYWLRRHGFAPTVVERAPAPRVGGHAVDIRGTALGVVERMGVLGRLRELSTDMRGMSFVNAAGKTLVKVTEHTLTGGLTDSDDVEILRDDLTDVLASVAQEGVEYVYGDWITGIAQRPDGVRVAFANGEARHFDLVIGADGQHSTVRSLVFGAEKEFSHHLDTYLAVFTVPNFLELDHWQTFHMTPGKLAGLYSARGNTEARAMLGFQSPELDFDRHDLDQQRKLLADRFLGQGWEVPRLVREMASSELYFDSMTQIRMDRFSDGRVALVGDAGYGPSPLSGQGTSLGLVGAYVLAGSLAVRGDHHAAFAEYEREMRPFVLRNQALASLNQKKQTRFAQWKQIQSMRMLPHLPFRDRVMKAVMRPLTEASNALVLKEY
ncbi:FAD-dependent monooxygenase [Amycolatopsis regifaucium]|uniref:FAD-dependent oxidoreductase n=1 Tax=Amycolatopsis regifaucium TaxID=546365 RepID=A0A154MMG2_9PSEU|nr:FAD-dependent monooxygenase [Amycolatopsis regifaucium]KZB85133.1 FAD-dependent oxidoreductase [Amycolatopsis regifaucium]OKA04157.1 FAD-dependent oxidoreductase [Amycolatopsis regifaucium]SFH92858.1 2-polyprenyl-6-methoxyphenol hydroxylase [Amycolatopsis regifaucium]